MNEVKLFCNEQFGEVRTVEIDGNIWFIGKDVAEALGYERPTKAVADHVDNEDVDGIPIQDSIGRMQNTPIINESGLYALILSSKLPSAKAFKHWITKEVLPSIRKTGSYSMKHEVPQLNVMVSEMAESKEALLKLFHAIPHDIAAVQCFNEVEKKYNVELTYLRKAIPANTTGDSDCYMKPTDLAKELNILYSTGRPNAQEVNKRLAEAGLQEKKNKEWHVTKKGMKYGKEFPYINGSHSGYEIRWKKDVSNIIM